MADFMTREEAQSLCDRFAIEEVTGASTYDRNPMKIADASDPGFDEDLLHGRPRPAPDADRRFVVAIQPGGTGGFYLAYGPKD